MTGNASAQMRQGLVMPPSVRSVMPTLASQSPFTRRQALDMGLTDAVLRGPTYQSVLTGVYLEASLPVTLAVRAQAALLVAPAGAVVARQTAARLWGGVVPDSPDVHLLVPRGRRFRRGGVNARETHVNGASISSVRRGGLPLTGPVRTFLDLAAELTLVELVVLGDTLVRRHVTTCADLVAGARRERHRGARRARRAAALVRAGVDSPMESRLRMLVVLAGLPEPVVNHLIRSDIGDWAVRFDLAFPELKVAIEYDGRQHAESTGQWVRDVGRREWLDNEGWRLLVVLSGDIYRHPSKTLERIVGALRDRGRLVSVTSNEWQRHFAGY